MKRRHCGAGGKADETLAAPHPDHAGAGRGGQGAAIWLVPRAIVATFIKRGATTMGLNRANADTLPTADAIEQASMNPAHEHLSKLLDE
jgi:hypothetical protein